MILPLATVVGASIVIWKACDYFEVGSNYVGRDMPAGVRGATINAIGSSLPELLTTFCLLFLWKDQDGFSAGIATCAGSAVFNMVIIPALVILAATWGKNAATPAIYLDKRVVIRDAVFFIGAEIVLIAFLGGTTMAWWMGAALLGIYVGYFTFLMNQKFGHSEDEDEDEDEVTTAKAWTYLALSTAVIAVACYGLSWAVIALAEAWQVPAYLTAVVFAAAATSVPDTVLSIKDARAGEYDDAVANAVGSNIFDICVCLGLPLLAYGLVYGDVTLSATAAGDAANVQSLRIALIVATVTVVGSFLALRALKPRHGLGLLGLFGAWLLFLSFQI